MEKVVETKTCKLCSISFDITDKDSAFYDKISPTFDGKRFPIPMPTLCSECRRKRRMTFRNEGKLYRRKCCVSGKDIITIYSEDKNLQVVDNTLWWKEDIVPEKWDVINPWISFLESFAELMTRTPFQASYVTENSLNSQFGNHTGEMKDCYLVFASWASEGVYYWAHLNDVHHSIDIEGGLTLHNSYQAIGWESCHDISYSMNCSNCSLSSFLFDCQNCEYCFMCYNLRGKKYHIENVEYSPEEYKKKVAQMRKDLFLSGWKWLTPIRDKAIKRNMNLISCENSFGDGLKNTQNCYDAYFIVEAKDCKYIENGALWAYDSYDGYGVGASMSLAYEVIDTWANSLQAWFTTVCHGCNHTYYSFNCYNSSHLFGCIGLRNKEYCILNKQYSKEEYEKYVSQIVTLMQEAGEWGEFFPSSMSPFGYNETVAHEYFPLTKEEAKERWYNWSDYEAPFPKVEKIIPASKLPDDISQIPDDVLNWAIECEVTKKPFKILKQELEFYRAHDIPLPKHHPEVRHIERMRLKNPRKLFDRKCDKCAKDMKTTYRADSKDRVFCEACYDKEIY